MTGSPGDGYATRRSFLLAASLAVPVSLAGCTGADEGPFDGWLANVENYQSVQDATGEDTVEVAVGVEGNGGHFAFGPPAIRVDAGTTVRWVWTGEGFDHDVVAADGRFASERTREAGHEFEYTFEEAGVCKYYCSPHRSAGMKGVVAVE